MGKTNTICITSNLKVKVVKMGLSASQGRMLLLTARKSDLEYRAQQISQKRLVLSQQLGDIALEYEDATSNRQMTISMYLNGTNDGTQSVTRSGVNLTYAALVSGTVSTYSAAQTGIQAYDRTANQEYASNVAYRLVDADGAIVVSSVEEIPGQTMSTVTGTTTKGDDGIYRAGKYTTEGMSESYGNYIVLPKNSDGTTSALGVALKSDDIDSNNIQFDAANKVVKVGNNFYDYTTGKKVSSSEKYTFSDDNVASIVDTADKVPTSKREVYNDATIKEGSDGKYSLLDSNGVIISRYVVDDSLKYGSTDTNGTTSGPNYLQDCLRNGKYLIEKGALSADTKELTWNSISWDATSNIADQYYTEDDDAAKAKYDRLQTQIQNQDKKLELELDNIETQRSAVTTEVESVQTVIDDNIESSFKTFA